MLPRMAAFPTVDLALRFDPVRFVTDVTIAEGDLVLDDTPVTPLLMALGCDRRALPDDVLPTGVSPLTSPATLVERRGWAGDALDRFGRLAGSRLWLLDREKKTDEVLRRAEFHVREALAWLSDELGITPVIEVTWAERSTQATGWLQIRVAVDGRSVTLVRKLAGAP
jgi:phage gp46-like protein